MVNILLLSLITSLFVFGWNYATIYSVNINFTPNTDPTKPAKRVEVKPTDYEILGLLRWYIRCIIIKIFPEKVDYIMKPLFGCPVCMSSVYGTIFYWYYILNSKHIINSKTLLLWGVTVVVEAGISRVLKSIMDK